MFTSISSQTRTPEPQTKPTPLKKKVGYIYLACIGIFQNIFFLPMIEIYMIYRYTVWLILMSSFFQWSKLTQSLHAKGLLWLCLSSRSQIIKSIKVIFYDKTFGTGIGGQSLRKFKVINSLCVINFVFVQAESVRNLLCNLLVCRRDLSAVRTKWQDACHLFFMELSQTAQKGSKR